MFSNKQKKALEKVIKGHFLKRRNNNNNTHDCISVKKLFLS